MDPEKRSAFCQKIEDYQKKGKPLVYLDESGFAVSQPRTHGYASKGHRCYGQHDWGAKGRINAIGALIGSALLTVSLFSNTINTVVFNSWIEQDLLPKLPPHSIVIMDNATFHKSLEMKETLEKAGHTLLYLPPYSPDLNPIEHKWAQAKALRRKTGCHISDLFLHQDM